MGDDPLAWDHLPLPALEIIACMGDPSTLRLVNSDWKDAVNRSIRSFILKAPSTLACLSFMHHNFKNLDALCIDFRAASNQTRFNTRGLTVGHSDDSSSVPIGESNESKNWVDSLATTLRSLPRLKSLKIRSNGVVCSSVSLRGISDLTKLTSISVLGPWIDSLEEPSTLTQLRKLELTRVNPTADSLAGYTSLTGLTHLTLSSTRVPGNAIHSLVSGMSNLSGLCLQNTRISDEGMSCISALKSLERLDIGYTQIGDTGVHHLKDLACLTYLSLRATRASDHSVPSLLWLSNLRVLILSRSYVTERGLSQLSMMQSLSLVNATGIWGLTMDEKEKLRDMMKGVQFNV